MAHQWLRCNLNASIFALATELWGRSVIVPGIDENYEKVLVSGTDLARDKGIPQVYYLHNTMPTAQGYQAIGYTQNVDNSAAAVTDFDKVFPFQLASTNQFLYCPAMGKNYIYDLNKGGWFSALQFLPGTISAATLITTAAVNGNTYIGIGTTGIYLYDEVKQVLVQQLVNSFDANISVIKGICGSYGYMLYWDDRSLVWSSVLDPLNITPSVVTGAGGGKLQQAKGKIIVVLPISGGVLVYCEKNVVSGRYTGNINFPFSFNEVPGSAGITTPENVSWQDNLDTHYAWTRAGLQAVSIQGQAQLFYPEVTEFLAGRIFEDFDESTLTWSSQYLTEVLNIGLTVVEEGYVIISYGVDLGIFTHALIFDIGLQRWGKVKITHTDCFQWNSPGATSAYTYAQLAPSTYAELAPATYADLAATIILHQEGPRKTIAFLQASGNVYTVNFDLSELTADGVLLLGKYQIRRNRRTVHQQTDVEVKGTGSSFNAYVVPTQDGKTLLAPIPMAQIFTGVSGPQQRRYGCMQNAYNISLLFTGSFDMVSVMTDLADGGKV